MFDDLPLQKRRHGVDSAYEPSLSTALQLAKTYEWTLVYIGGPFALNKWEPAKVRELSKAWKLFEPCYVGQQNSFPGNPAVLGHNHGMEACNLMPTYGWPNLKKIPITLDIEAETFNNYPNQTLEYGFAWAGTVRSGGYDPVIYGTLTTILAFERLGLNAGYHVSLPNYHSFQSGLDPRTFRRSNNWRHMGYRSLQIWQYAFEVSGFDLNVSRGRLAKAPGEYV